MNSPRPFLTADWRYLAMLNFEVPPEVLVPYLPVGTELDLYRKRALISIFGVQFSDVRIRGLAIPLHRRFAEVNLRFYVRRQIDGKIRRGVVALKEIVPKWAIAWVARTFYQEDFISRRMRHTVEHNEELVEADYSWIANGRWRGVKQAVDYIA